MVIVLFYPKKQDRIVVPDTFSQFEVEMVVRLSKAVCYEVEDEPTR